MIKNIIIASLFLPVVMNNCMENKNTSNDKSFPKHIVIDKTTKKETRPTEEKKQNNKQPKSASRTYYTPTYYQ